MSEQTTAPAHDPWSTETGLLTDYEGEVIEAWFTTDPKYNDGKTLLFVMKMKTDDADNPEWEERYGCGPDWGSYDGGETAEHPKGDTKRFNKNSQYGHLIDKALECGAGEALASRGTPRSAKVWVGTKWFFEAETKEVNFKDAQGEQVKREVTRGRAPLHRILPLQHQRTRPLHLHPPKLLHLRRRRQAGARVTVSCLRFLLTPQPR
jgi:hypothetical protein